MKKQIKKIILSICTISALFLCIPTALAENDYTDSDKIKLSAECAVLIEANSRRVLFASNAMSKRAMASTTKIMTALVIIQNCNLDDIVTIPKEAQGVEGSSIYLTAGEKLSVKDLLYGLMLRSGNDAATALALHCSGSINEFAELMNSTAAQLGLEHTHFANPSGLPNENHYTTAYELSIIAAQAMQNNVFREIVSTTNIKIPWDGHDSDRILINKNKMLAQYDGADGIKTGYTMAAGRCLVASATKNGMTLIAVVLNSSPMYADCSKMLDYGFENYHMQEIIKANDIYGSMPIDKGFIDSIDYVTEKSVSLPIKDNDTVSIEITLNNTVMPAPVYRGDVTGRIDVVLNGEVVDSSNLALVDCTDKNTFFSRFSNIWKQHLCQNK